MALRRVVRIRNRAGARAVLRRPLMRAGRALGQLPFVAEQVLEEVVAPLRRRRGPGDFQAAGDRVTAVAGAEAVLPAEALLLDVGAFGLGADMSSRRPAPWVLPKVWPPAISATVSSSFIAMRRRFRGCPAPRRADRGCRSGLPGSRRSGPSARRQRILRDRGRRCSARPPATSPSGPQ